jgi:tripartite-type tricarboxylate transporter receptor subunit TctC
MTHPPSHRRALLCAAASTAALFALAPAHAQAPYPNKPIRMVVPFQAGGATDVLARVLGQKMSAGFGQPVVIDNKPGAAGIIGTDAVAKSAPDGYTLVFSLSNALLTNEFLYEKLPYDTQRDLTLVYQVAMGPLVLVVHPSVPVKTAPELLKYVAANKSKVAYGSYGVGAYPHLAGAHMSLTQQADMNHVAYKGEAPMMQDLIGGQIQMAYASALVAKPHIDAGKVRAIGVSGERRMAALPNVPTMAEQGLKDEAYRGPHRRRGAQGHAAARRARARGGHGLRAEGQLARTLCRRLERGAPGVGAAHQAIGREARVIHFIDSFIRHSKEQP